MIVLFSLTSIRGRERQLVSTLRSIIRSASSLSLPYEIRLYLSEEPYLLDKGFPRRELPIYLSEFIDSHNVIKTSWVTNTGSFRKMIPVVKECHESKRDDVVIVLCDDDITYPSTFAKELVNKTLAEDVVACQRAWEQWPETPKRPRRGVKTEGCSIRYCCTTGGGVSFRPHHVLSPGTPFTDERLALSCCKGNDDVWFNCCRVATGSKTYCFGRWGNGSYGNQTVEGPSLWVTFNQRNKKDSAGLDSNARAVLSARRCLGLTGFFGLSSVTSIREKGLRSNDFRKYIL